MRGLLEALQFLTILRFKSKDNIQRLASSIRYFPLVGALLGLILIVINKYLSLIFPQNLTSLILVFTLIILTGALHLDGLADTFDAILGGRTKEERLKIFHDVHKGTFGVLALLLIILFKISFISLIPENIKNFGLFLMGVLSRYSLALAIGFFPYAREEGKAKVFFGNRSLKNFYISSLITLFLLGLTLQWRGVLILFSVIISTLIMGLHFKSLLGGLTGDNLGAICEINELVVLLSVFCCIGN